MGTLDGKVALITGTAAGMGRVAALIFAREGAQVVGADIQVGANDETVELVRRAGGEMTGIAPVDLTDPDAVRQLAEDAAAAYGGLDVVYNNAAMQRFGPMPDFSVEDWRATEANSTSPSSCRSSPGRIWSVVAAASSSTSRRRPA